MPSLPNKVTLPLALAGFLLGTFATSLPASLQELGAWLGVLCLLFAIGAFAHHWLTTGCDEKTAPINDIPDHVGPDPSAERIDLSEAGRQAYEALRDTVFGIHQEKWRNTMTRTWKKPRDPYIASLFHEATIWAVPLDCKEREVLKDAGKFQINHSTMKIGDMRVHGGGEREYQYSDPTITREDLEDFIQAKRKYGQ